jgi:hypothetical protein
MTTKSCKFSKKEYNSGNGMLTYIWGPSTWHFLHTISFNYPIKPTSLQKKQYVNYIKSLQTILPCVYCRNNMTKNLKACNFNMSVMKNRNTFSRFIYKLHEQVNKMLGKKSNLSYVQVRDRYENFRAHCITNKKLKISKKEQGCTKPLYGVRSKCVLSVVPKTSRCKSFTMDKKCKLKKI